MQAKGTIFYSKKTLNLQGKLLTLDCPKVMGILNVTPDSFYDGGKHQQSEQLLAKVSEMLAEGVDMLDVGGYSSRPNADDISPQEEIDRVLPAIELIQQHYPQTPISIDTFRAKVALEAVGAGACMINDISGGNLDGQMFETVAKLQVPYVLMHMRGTPQTMTTLNEYEDLVSDVVQDLQQKVAKLHLLGVHDIVVDPGFGFAKNIAQNFELLKHLSMFQALGLPVLVGVSRKSMIYKTLQTSAEEALHGTIALNTVALQNGANILRVHDVKAAKDAVAMIEAIG